MIDDCVHYKNVWVRSSGKKKVKKFQLFKMYWVRMRSGLRMRKVWTRFHLEVTYWIFSLFTQAKSFACTLVTLRVIFCVSIGYFSSFNGIEVYQIKIKNPEGQLYVLEAERSECLHSFLITCGDLPKIRRLCIFECNLKKLKIIQNYTIKWPHKIVALFSFIIKVFQIFFL